MLLYIAVCCDRHRDPKSRAFSNRHDAQEFARAWCGSQRREELLYDDGSWFLTRGDEGDYAMVTESKLDDATLGSGS